MNVVLMKKATTSVSKYCAKPEYSCQCWVKIGNSKTGSFLNYNHCGKQAVTGMLTCREHNDLDREARKAKALWDDAAKFVK